MFSVFLCLERNNSDMWEILFNKSWVSKIFPFKEHDLEFGKSNYLACFRLKLARKCKYAGFAMELALIGFYLQYELTDTRYWDSTTNTWIL